MFPRLASHLLYECGCLGNPGPVTPGCLDTIVLSSKLASFFSYGIEPGDFCMLDKHSSTELYSRISMNLWWGLEPYIPTRDF